MIQAISQSQSTFSPPPTKAPSSCIQKIALDALQEFALCLILAAACSAFTTTPILLLTGLAIQCLVNIALRCIFGTSWWTAPVTAIGSFLNPQILCHEAGHASAIGCLLEKSGRTLELFPYSGGTTRFRVVKPSALGEWIGKKHLQPLIAAAGPVSGVCVAALQYTAGRKLNSRHPELSRALIVSALINILFHAIYALSALWASPKNLAHDFVALKLAGVHPIFATLAILSFAFVVYVPSASKFKYSQWTQ